MAKRQKAHQLPISTRRAIARKKEQYPTISYGELARQFNCTYDQARYAHQQYLDGGLEGRSRRRKRKGEIKGDATLVSQYEVALDELARFDLDPKERIALLEKLVTIRKTCQQIELTGHLKRTDAEVIARIIRRYEPDASDDRVIAIYKEEIELWKASL